MSDSWNSNKKAGAPDCGLFLSIKASDFGIGDQSKAQAMLAKLRQAVQGINASPYEKNFAIVEFIPDMGDDSQTIAEGLKDFVSAKGLILLIRDNLKISASIGADGIMFTSAKKASKAREVAGDDPIIGAYDSAEDSVQPHIQSLDLVRMAEGTDLNELLKFKAINSDVMLLPSMKDITNDNCASLVLAGADFIDVTNYTWSHPENPTKAIVNMLYAIDIATEATNIKQ